MDGILTNISAKAAAEAWLDDFGAALASGEAARIAALFAADCHWRDILAFTWDLRHTSGAAVHRGAHGVRPRANGAARVGACPGPHRRHGMSYGQASRRSKRSSSSRLPSGAATASCASCPKAAGSAPGRLMTTLDEIRGHEDPANGRRWQDVDWNRNFGGENWLDRRKRAQAYADRDPAVSGRGCRSGRACPSQHA